jgi:hypothetical protein
VTSDERGISKPTRPDAARELDCLQIIDNRPLAVSLPRPDEFSRLMAVHPVIPLETLRETLVDGPVDDEKAVQLVHLDLLCIGLFP